VLSWVMPSLPPIPVWWITPIPAVVEVEESARVATTRSLLLTMDHRDL